MNLISWVQRSFSTALNNSQAISLSPQQHESQLNADESWLREEINSLLALKDSRVVVVNSDWFHSLVNFLQNGPKPGKIDASVLLTKSKKLKKGLKPGLDYFFVYASVWSKVKCCEDETIFPSIHKKLIKLTHLAEEHMSLLMPCQETSRADPTEIHLPLVIPRNDYFENPEIDAVEIGSQKDGISTNFSSIANLSSEGSVFGSINPHRGRVGLENPGLYCYLNSGIQCLLSVPQFVQIMLKIKQLGMLDDKKLSLLLATLIQTFFEVKNGWILKTAPLRKYVSEYFPENKQHDMPELFRFLINQVTSELGPGNIIVKDVFNGVLCSTIVCTECGNLSKKEEVFIDLQVELSSSLDNSLESFLKEEVLSAGYHCGHCRRDTVAAKSLSVLSAPKCLSIQIKRFKQMPIPHKSASFVKYRRKMQVKTFDGFSQYELISVGVHIGSMSSGHYITYAKRYRSWYCFDDSICTKVDLKRALSQTAYMLVYKLIQ